jgi:RNA polymerase sigma factor (sigma-70 family)
MVNPACVLVDESRFSTMPSSVPIVFVVDDDISVRESLELMIRSAGWQAELYKSAQDFIAKPRPAVPSCLVLDVNLPDFNGMDLQKSIGQDRPEMPIIFITGYGDIPLSVRAMKAGAMEFLTKPFEDEVLLRAIADALDRSRSALDREKSLHALRNAYASLTPREREVLTLVDAGRLNKQIAADLGISEITVKAHRGKVMRKMKARSLADLVKMAAQLSLAPAARD